MIDLVPRRALALIAIGALAGSAAADGGGRATKTARVTGVVTVTRDGKALAQAPPDVYVYVVDDEDPAGTTRPDVEIAQQDFTFTPALQVVPVGTRVFFPNRDKALHSVFSQDPEYIDLGRDAKKNKSFVFDFEGEIDIYCDIHPDMAAKVKVMPSARFVRVAADGSYAIDVPVGKRTLAVWMPDTTDLEQTVTVGADTAAVDFKLRAGKAKKGHKTKAGKPYDRYKP